MRIRRVELRTEQLGLVEPYLLADGWVDHATNCFVRVVTDGPHVGLGCAAPEETVTGESLLRCERALADAAEALVGMDPLRTALCLAAVAPHTDGAPAALAAIDAALHDLLGKAAGMPLYRLLGGFRTRMLTSVTVFIDPPPVMAERARVLCARGFRAIKLKGGRDVDEDIEAVRRVREAVGPDVALRFDANQGWTVEQALRFLRAIGDAELELVEQPTRAALPGALKAVTDAALSRVMADESLLGLSDALHLAHGGRSDMVNIKLMKVGGLDAALAINAVVRAAGIEAMVGCMDESALGIAAGLHLALARPNIELADLDGHLDLAWDPAAGAVLLEDGYLRPHDAPGLGVRDFA